MKRQPPTKSTRVKAVARQRVGSPKPARVIPDKRQQVKLKHKKDFEMET